MADSFSVKAILSAKDSGFSSTLKSCSSALDRIDSKVSGISFGFLSSVGQSAFNGLKNSATELIGAIDASNTSWKTFAGNMKILGKSTEEIEKVKGDLQDFAQKTVYSSSDMATTYAQLEAVGVKSCGDLVKSFGGLAAASENPQQAMKTLSQQATQMAAKPNVAWQDFKLMLEQTPAGISAVAKEMGMSTSEMVTAVQAGEVATDKFFEAIIKAGGAGTEFEAMATEFKTIGQATDGLMDSLAYKLTPAFEIVTQAGIKGLNAISGMFDKIDSKKLEGTITKVIGRIEKFVTNVKKYAAVAKESFAGVGTKLKDAFNAIKTSFTGMTSTFGSTEDIEGFKGVMDKVADVIKRLLTSQRSIPTQSRKSSNIFLQLLWA